jgi:hypothetical protein
MYQQYHPESYASSNRSVPSPEGVENAQPNINISNDFLPLGPDTGLNEAQHRRTSSVHTDMSYQMRRFLIERDYNQPISAPTPASSPARFLSQETHILSQAPQRREKTEGSKQSKKSLQSSGGGDLSYIGFGADDSTAIGAWAEGDDGVWENQYAMTLSGFSELFTDE